MKTIPFLSVLILAHILCGSGPAKAQIELRVKPNEIRSTVSPQMWGIFFEDINFAADGGLYAELIKNGSFQFPLPFTGWKVNKVDFKDKVLVVNQSSVKNGNTRYVRIAKSSDSSVYNIVNEGFRGIGLHKNAGYTFSMRARTISGNLRLRVEVLRESGQSLVRGDIANLKGGWTDYTLPLTAPDSESKGLLKIAFLGTGVVEIDLISLFPVNTYKNRPGGLRADLAAMLDSLKPGFVRFPGGCIVEGHTLASRYQWKKRWDQNRSGNCPSTGGIWNSQEGRHRTIISPSAWVFMNISSCRKIWAPNLSPSSIAAWPASSTAARSLPWMTWGLISRMPWTLLNLPMALYKPNGANSVRTWDIRLPSTSR
ncbi:MAG TPA: hypothetical protein PKM27_01495 [Saprospiraceae bacterium]|nr:hypothetical protein [Saprospiraceae bacterium]